MKRLFLMLLLPFTGFGQAYHSSNSFFFLPQVTVQQYQGRPYRCKVSIRYVPADTTAHVSLLVTQVGKSDDDYKKFDKLTEAIRPGEWHTYTIQGQLVPGAKKVWLYSAMGGNGTFFFDNLTMQVQQLDQSWQNVNIKNGDFEHSKTPLAGYKTGSKGLSATTVAALVQGQGPDQSQALRITLSGGTLVKAAVPYGRNQAAGRFCQLTGVRLYYETYGKGEPLLLLHGNGESISSFRNQIESFAAHYQVIAVDTRAQGQSVDTLTRTLTYELFASDLRALLDSLHLRKASIVGWSDGGNTGLLMSQLYPTYVHKLVTMGANLFPTTEAVDAKTLRETEQARQTLVRQGKLAEARLLTLVLTEPHMRYEELRDITIPTLVLAGEKDIIKPAHTQAIASHLANGQAFLLKGATHYAPQENPTLFNETVLRFLMKEHH